MTRVLFIAAVVIYAAFTTPVYDFQPKPGSPAAARPACPWQQCPSFPGSCIVTCQCPDHYDPILCG